MSDSRRKTLFEVCTGKLVSFTIGYFVNWALLSYFGIEGEPTIYASISAIAVGIATFRSYLWRRMFNRLHIFEENGTHFS